MSGAVFNLIAVFTAPSRPLLRLKLQRDFTVIPRRAVPASPGGDVVGRFCKPILRTPARCRSFARSDRPARLSALRTRLAASTYPALGVVARSCAKASGWCADHVDDPALVTAGREFALDLGRPVGASANTWLQVSPANSPSSSWLSCRPHRSPHIAGSASARRPRSRGSCGRKAAAMLLGQRASRSSAAVGGFCFHPAGVRPACSSSFPRDCPLRRHRHDTCVDDLPATRHVALGREMLV